MFSGRRPGKRSIVGTRVCAPYTGGFYWPGVISAIQTAGPWEAIADRYVVEFEDGSRRTFDGDSIVGAGFQSMTKERLNVGQTVFITHNGREVEGTVERVDADDCVAVALADNGMVVVPARTEDVRLMKSRRSARLSESQQDAVNMARSSSPFESSHKRLRPADVACTTAARSWSYSCCSSGSVSGDGREMMDEHLAALALTSLSCSPASPILHSTFDNFQRLSSRCDSGMSSGVWTMNSEASSSASPHSSPNKSFLSSSAPVDSFIQFDDDDDDDVADGDDVYMKDAGSSMSSREKRSTVYQCMWRGCRCTFHCVDDVESHVRDQHLSGSEILDDDEDFYYTEVEESPSASSSTSSSPVLDVTSAADLARRDAAFSSPTAMDHDYQRKDYWSEPVNIVRRLTSSHRESSSLPVMMTSLSSTQDYASESAGVDTTARSLMLSPGKLPAGRKSRNGDIRKCRKVYGIENRSLWCTQCKWKKACSRFSVDFC